MIDHFLGQKQDKSLYFLLRKKGVEAIFREPISVHFVLCMVVPPPIFPVLYLPKSSSFLHGCHLTYSILCLWLVCCQNIRFFFKWFICIPCYIDKMTCSLENCLPTKKYSIKFHMNAVSLNTEGAWRSHVTSTRVIQVAYFNKVLNTMVSRTFTYFIPNGDFNMCFCVLILMSL